MGKTYKRKFSKWEVILRSNIILICLVGLMFTGCAFTDSALKYSYEGTKRVQSGYDAKAKMTHEIVEYLKVANAGCGVKVEVINGTPVTTVRECIRPADMMASVDRVQIIKPQHIADMAESAGNFMVSATNLVVPVASIYYGFKNNKVNQEANIAMNSSDNTAQSNMWANYTGSYQNSVTNTSTTTDKNTQITKETTNEKVPTISVDTNSTTIN